MTETTELRTQRLNDVRAIVNWLEDNPTIPLPYDFQYGGFNIVAWDAKPEAAAMARAMGSFDKSFDDNFLTLTKKFGTIHLKAVFSRSEVCERVVVGKELVPEVIVPARIEPEHEREIIEWRCDSVLSTNSQPTDPDHHHGDPDHLKPDKGGNQAADDYW